MINSYQLSYYQCRDKGKLCGDAKKKYADQQTLRNQFPAYENGMKLYNWNTCIKGCFVQPFVKLGVRKPELGEFFGLFKNNKLIPHLKPKQLLFNKNA
jgi:hypothetical protein